MNGQNDTQTVKIVDERSKQINFAEIEKQKKEKQKSLDKSKIVKK